MTAGPPDPRVTLIVDRLQRRMAEPVTVAELARTVNLSESRFRALFAAQTGMAPGQYLQRIRLRAREHAAVAASSPKHLAALRTPAWTSFTAHSTGQAAAATMVM